MEFGERIKAWRLGRRMTPAEAASHLEVDGVDWMRWEHGQGLPATAQQRRILAALPSIRARGEAGGW